VAHVQAILFVVGAVIHSYVNLVVQSVLITTFATLNGYGMLEHAKLIVIQHQIVSLVLP